MIHAFEIKIDVIMQILLTLGMLIMVELSLKHVRAKVCHDQVSLSQVMDLYYFVYEFIIFSIVYDDVFGKLEWFQVRIYVKKEEKARTVRARNGRK